MSTKPMRLVLLWTMAIALPACGEADGKSQSALSTCEYGAFSATVRQGTNMNTEYRGDLMLAQFDATTVRGVLAIPGTGGAAGTLIPVTGTLSGQVISLALSTAKGKLNGTGTLPSAFSACPANVQGVLTGPTSNDTGDWAGMMPVQISPTCTQQSEGGGGLSITCTNGGIKRKCIYPVNQAPSCEPA